MREDQHEMEMTAKHASGAEEWHCPTCGRRFLLQWPPAYKKIVLEPGDEHAIHSGSKGGLHITSVGMELSDDASLSDGLKPWLKGIEDLGLDERWDEDA